MNNKGFSIIWTGLSILVVLIIIAVGSNVISRAGKEHSIESQIDSLHISATLQSKQCNLGDGVDSGAQCRYVYSDNGSVVEAALKNAGYTALSGNLTEAGGSTLATLTGGDPVLSIQLNRHNGITTLDATREN
jgi:hypothetical protein